MTHDKQYKMEYLQAEAYEEFIIPSEAEDVDIDYREREDGSKYVRVSYLVRTDGGGSIR